MHNVNLTKLEQTIDKARNDPQAMRQPVNLDGQWQTEHGAPQFRGTISYPSGEVEFACDFPPPMGGSGAAPNPLAHCLWGGIACYAMTYATEAARDGIPLAALRGTITTEVDQTRALGVTDNPRSSRSSGRCRSKPTRLMRPFTRSRSEPTSAAPGCTACATPST